MPEFAKVYGAQLRWSGRQGGLEIAPLDSQKGGDTRRQPRVRGGVPDGTHGLQLVDDLEADGYGEGDGVIVIALPKCMSDAQIEEARALVEYEVRQGFPAWLT